MRRLHFSLFFNVPHLSDNDIWKMKAIKHTQYITCGVSGQFGTGMRKNADAGTSPVPDRHIMPASSALMPMLNYDLTVGRPLYCSFIHRVHTERQLSNYVVHSIMMEKTSPGWLGRG